MREVKGDMWSYLDRKNFYIFITTNGFIKNNGEGVMGAGCAREAAERFPALPRLLGFSLKNKKNIVSKLTNQLYSFPVKHNWYEKADIKLIKKSIKRLEELALSNPDKKYVVPRPGCGNGKLDWKDVRPYMKHLPDNVFVITKE